VNGRFYIGVHKQEGVEFDGYLGSGVALQRAVKKYGVDSFLRETLYSYDILEEAYEKEKELVNSDFVKEKKNYNLSSGGRGLAGNKLTNEESRKKMSLAQQNRSKETRKKMGLVHKGKCPWNKGITHSDETRTKISLSRKGKTHSDETKKKISLPVKEEKYQKKLERK
jgi:hypothetical protein